MKLIINCSDDEIHTIEEFDRDTVVDLLDVLNDPEEMFMQFTVHGRPVVLNKFQIISLEIT